MAKIREPLLQELGSTSAVSDRLQSRENQTRLDQQRIYARLNITPSQLKQFCKAHHIVELSLFGSVLRDDFRADSDIDVMVVFDRRANPNLSLMDLVGIQYQLEDWIGRKVDLIEKRSVVNSHNAIRRNNILNTSQIIYES